MRTTAEVDAALERFAALDEKELAQPWQVRDKPMDVRYAFRLHRFAAHLVEHTVQCEKALAALGWRATEGRRIVRRLTALLGEVEGLAGRADAREIETQLVERSASSAPA